jgi:hemolysin III
MVNTDEEIDIREELINSLTHGAGVLFGIIGIPFLILQAVHQGNNTSMTASIVYGISFMLVFTASTLFHSKHPGKLRERLKILDHISIYFLIAGTYTPFILIYVNNSFGLNLLIILWSLTAVGTLFKLFFTGRYELLSIFIYVAMGWMLLTGGDSFFEQMPASVISLIICGGALYMIGILFYVRRWFVYHHAVWHIFVLSAAICHYAAILKAV